MTYAPPAIDLNQILARAVPASERAASGWVEPDPGQDPASARRYAAAWKAAVSREPEGAAWLQEVLHLPDAALEAMFAPVRVREGALPPAWAEVIIRVLEAEPFAEPASAGDVFGPFMALASSDLAAIIARTGLDAQASAATDLLGMLRVRLGRTVSPALEHEQQMLNATAHFFTPEAAEGGHQLDGSVDGWLHRLNLLPALAHVIGTCYVHWRRFVGEMCARTVQDSALIGRTLLGCGQPGALVSVAGDTGDLHNEGRAVAILGFEGGGQVVYKPKDLTVAAAWMDLSRFLNGAGLALDLPVRTIVLRGEYTWEQFIEAEPCASPAQVSRFYRRMGETIRLLQFLEARDFWLDNLIASGEYPHFIDIEMLLQPRRPLPGSLSSAEQAAFAWLEESAARTSAIAMPMPIAAGVPSQELGALGPVGPFASPFRFDLAALAGSAGAPPLTEEGYVLWTHPEHVPVLDGAPVSSEDYLDDVRAGYAAMQECLASVQTALAADDGPLGALATAPIRYIHRDTWSCLKLVHRSVQPGLLADAVHRDLFLAQLFQPIAGDPERQPEDARVIAAEIQGLRQLDVPFFLTRPTSDEVYAPDGSLRQAFFPGVAWDRLQVRIAKLDTFPLDEHLALVQSTYASGRPLGAPWREVETGPVPSPGTEACLAVAEGIGRDILARSHGDGTAWDGLIHHPVADVPGLEVLRPDVLTGTTGLAMLFADLFVATGAEPWREAALQAIEPSLRSWRNEVDRARQGAPSLSSAGAHYGLGAWIWGLDRVGRGAHATGLADALCQGREMMGSRLRETPFDGDTVTGQTGLLLACLVAFPDVVDRDLAESIVPCLMDLLDDSATRRPGKADHGLRSLPDASTGAAVALARLQQVFSLEVHGALDRWAGSRLAEVAGGQLNAGTLAGLIEVAPLVGRGDETRTACDRWIARHLELNDSWRLLDVIDLSLALAGSSDVLEPARIAAGQLLAMRDRHGTWFPGAWADDRHNLSAIWGQAAVAHALARIGGGSGIASLRLPG